MAIVLVIVVFIISSFLISYSDLKISETANSIPYLRLAVPQDDNIILTYQMSCVNSITLFTQGLSLHIRL